MSLSHIILEAYTNKTKDWNGNYVYDKNPLEKYKDHKLYADCIISYTPVTNNIEKILVRTSKEFILVMGWSDDLKYIKKQ